MDGVRVSIEFSSEKGKANRQFAWSSQKAASKESRQTTSLPYHRGALFILSAERKTTCRLLCSVDGVVDQNFRPECGALFSEFVVDGVDLIGVVSGVVVKDHDQ